MVSNSATGKMKTLSIDSMELSLDMPRDFMRAGRKNWCDEAVNKEGKARRREEWRERERIPNACVKVNTSLQLLQQLKRPREDEVQNPNKHHLRERERERER